MDCCIFSHVDAGEPAAVTWRSYILKPGMKMKLHITFTQKALGDIDVDGRVILKRILKEQGVRGWNGLVWLWIGGQWQALVKAVMILWII
jgi:hypothetical protein